MKLPTSRTCIHCGEVIKAYGDLSLLEAFSNHEMTHLPTTGQWHDAYIALLRDRDRAKKEARQDDGR